MSEIFVAKNELEKKLVAAQAGEISGSEFMRSFFDSEVFMPIEDDVPEGGIQTSDKAKSLVLKSEDGVDVLILFTSPERAKDFVADYPDYQGGLLAEFKWIVEKMGSGYGVALNPGHEVGMDMEPDMVEQLRNT